MQQVIHTPHAPAPIGPYSQAIAAQGWLFVSGQIPLHPVTGQIQGAGDVVEQTRQVMENLKAVLAAAKCGFDQVVKCTIYIKNMGDFPKINEVYGSYFNSSSAPPPARATVEVARLPKDVLVEIDCVAFLKTDSQYQKN